MLEAVSPSAVACCSVRRDRSALPGRDLARHRGNQRRTAADLRDRLRETQLHALHGREQAVRIATARLDDDVEFAIGDAAGNLRGISRFAAELAQDAASNQADHDRHRAAQEQRRDDILYERGIKRGVDVIGEYAGDDSPVPRLEQAHVVDLRRHLVRHGLHELQMDEAFAVTLREIDAFLEHEVARRVLEPAHVLAFQIGTHAMHQHFRMRVLDHQIAACAVVVHHPQIGQRVALGVG